MTIIVMPSASEGLLSERRRHHTPSICAIKLNGKKSPTLFQTGLNAPFALVQPLTFPAVYKRQRGRQGAKGNYSHQKISAYE